jgi:hypothetical protein
MWSGKCLYCGSERLVLWVATAKARGRTGGRPRTDVTKLENARILYENSEKTAAEVCEIAGVGRQVFVATCNTIANSP